MKNSSLHILRVGLGVTFLWIGIMIFRQPEAWLGYIQPWALNLLPGPVKQAMIGTAILDMAVGVLLLAGWWTWLAALVGMLHVLIVLLVSGVTDITVRDIGILAATITLTIESWRRRS